MTHATADINRYIAECHPEENVFRTIYNDLFPDDSAEVVMSRHDPSTAREIEYTDGTKAGNLSISYWARSHDAARARALLDKIIRTIDGITLEAESGVLDIEAVTLPQFVSIDDKKNTAYCCAISVQYIRE